MDNLITYIVVEVLIASLLAILNQISKRKKKQKNNNFKFIITNLFVAIAITISVISFQTSQEVSLDAIIPKLQAKPIGIDEREWSTAIIVDIINYSDYKAKNILIDIKLGENSWIGEVKNARLEASLPFRPDSNKEVVKKHLINSPQIPKLLPQRGMRCYMGDKNKDWLLKEDFYRIFPDGSTKNISPEQSISFLQSQDWKSHIYNLQNNESIRVLLKVEWENEFGRKFGDIQKYDLECTIAFNERRFQFIYRGIYLEANSYSN